VPFARLRRNTVLLGLACALAAPAAAQQPTSPTTPSDTTRPAARARPWYERLSLRGYTQVRAGWLVASDDDPDRRADGVSIRRARLVVSGEVHPRVSVYIQPDLAAAGGGLLHVAQLRDAYFDVSLDRARALRLRVGQSKVPYGFENMQSSSNRAPQERTLALNSGVPGERDLGAFLYWSPPAARARFRALTDLGLKGSGDYGVLGVGAYNGQSINRPEQNDEPHVVARVAYPFRLPNGQFVEVGVQGYAGRFVIPASQRSSGVVAPSAPDDGAGLADERAAVSLVVYPQPFGLQVEWNVGRGPEFDPASRTIRVRGLEGGYAMAMYRARVGDQVLLPFVRGQHYDGGRKTDVDARHYRARELEAGIEWQPLSAFELTAAYVATDHRTADGAAPQGRDRGHFLRLQAQFNY
jgi:hypothetical protein